MVSHEQTSEAAEVQTPSEESSKTPEHTHDAKKNRKKNMRNMAAVALRVGKFSRTFHAQQMMM